MRVFNQRITDTWLKENISMIALIPTVLGGIWQLLELMSLGAPFIRFFSVSQLVSDGLLILFVLLICLFGFAFLGTAEISVLSKFVFKQNRKELQLPENPYLLASIPGVNKIKVVFATVKLMILPFVFLARQRYQLARQT